MNTITLQQGAHLNFYCHALTRHRGMLLTEWLLEQARKNGLGGGSVFRATAGFGRHGVLHEDQFFELADNLPVKVEFLLGEAQADAMVKLVTDAGVDAVYARSPASFAVLGPAA
jgi:PII-like signaling protein